MAAALGGLGGAGGAGFWGGAGGAAAGAGIASGLDAISNMAGTLHGAKQASDEARKMRKFQAWWAANKYQVTVEDLRKAGLNPILAVAQGGAMAPSSPPGAMAHIGRSDFGRPGSAFERGISAARAAKERQILENEVERTYHAAAREAELGAVASEEALLKREQRATEKVHRDLMGSQIQLSESHARAFDVQAELDRLLIPGRQAEAAIDRGDFFKKLLSGEASLGEWTRAVQRLNPLFPLMKGGK